jgi:hypothetical protein
MPWLLVLFGVLFAGAVVAAVCQVRRDMRERRMDAEERRCLARRLHWEYEEEEDGRYRIHAVTNGVAWRWEPVPNDSEDHKMRWFAEHPRASRAELAIVSRAIDDVMRGKLGQVILWLGRKEDERIRDAHDLYGLPQRMELGSTEFREKFIARVHDPNVARRVIDREVEELLLRWPEYAAPPRQKFHAVAHLGIAFNARGLQIEVGTEVTKAAVVEQIVKLGCAVAHRLR